MKPHKHAELIKAWADGAEIEVFSRYNDDWMDCPDPTWEQEEYRIKPEPEHEQRLDRIRAYRVSSDMKQIGQIGITCNDYGKTNLILIWDGETGELKDSKVIL